MAPTGDHGALLRVSPWARRVVPALLRVVSPYDGPWRVVPALLMVVSPYDGPWRVVPLS